MTDRPDYRKYLEQKFKGNSEAIKGIGKLVNAQFITVHERLDEIKTQTTKTNSRVDHLEDKVQNIELSEATHVINCPVNPKVTLLSEELLEYKMFKKYPKIGIAVLLVAMILTGLNVFGIVEVFVKKPTPVEQGTLDRYQSIIERLDSLHLIIE